MTNKQILEKAIKKAVKSEWKSTLELKWVKNLKENQLIDPTGYYQYTGWIYQLIFSHDFAKAFWGKNEIIHTGTYEEFWEDGDGYIDGGDEIELPAWQYHLQQRVLEEDKIKYLEKFI